MHRSIVGGAEGLIEGPKGGNGRSQIIHLPQICFVECVWSVGGVFTGAIPCQKKKKKHILTTFTVVQWTTVG